MDQLTQNVNDLQLDSSEDGNWETVTKKNKIKTGSGAAKSRGTYAPTYVPKQPNRAQRPGMHANGSGKAVNFSGKNQAGSGVRPTRNIPSGQSIPPPLKHGWDWVARSVSSSENSSSNLVDSCNEKNGDDEDHENPSSDDDDLFSDDGFDSDASQQSHGCRKKHKMLSSFFDSLDELTIEEINEPSRQWHCPACQRGPGAIDWYKGLQPLLTHAKTKGSKRIKLHREFAQLLEEELRIRGASVKPSGEAFGQWEGLKEEKDHEIVWPPMVVIMNTQLGKDDDDKWIGMGNQELLEYFSSYAASRARHSYGPQGHRGMSVLIFEESAVGYTEANRLHKHFLEQGTGRDDWKRKGVSAFQGGRRQLFGFMAVKEDLDVFNYHSRGKQKLKYDMRSYQEKVVSQMREMSEDNQQLIYLKNKVVQQKMETKSLEAANATMRKSLDTLSSENRIVRQRSRMQHDEDKELMDYMDKFHKDRMHEISETTVEQEDDFEMLHQHERKKMEETTEHASNAEDYKRRADKLDRFIKAQNQEAEEFAAERDALRELHKQEKLEMKKKHNDEELELEKNFVAQLTNLMKKHCSKIKIEDLEDGL